MHLEHNITVQTTELTNKTNQQEIIAAKGRFLPSLRC